MASAVAQSAALAGSAAAFAAPPTAMPASSTSSSSPSSSSSAPVRTKAVTAEGTPVQLDSVEDAVASFRNGEFLVVVDDMDRENEGDLIIAADKISQQQMAWLIQHSSCVPLSSDLCPSRSELTREPLSLAAATSASASRRSASPSWTSR